MEVTPQPIPDGSVVITPNQQYAELRALTLAVQDLASKVDPAIVGLRKDVDDQGRDLDAERVERRADVEKVRIEVAGVRSDISALQKWQYTMGGALLLLGLLVGWGALNFAKVLGG